MSDITILGAGVAGLTVATALRARGLSPRVIARDAAASPGVCSWYAGGMLAPFCEGETAEPVVLQLGQAATDWWARHTTVTRRGTLVLALARDRADLQRFARRTQAHEAVDAPAIAALEPDLAGRAPQGLYYPTEAHLDPRRALADLARPLTIERGEVSPSDLPGTVIDCRGLSAQHDLPDLRGVRGEMAVLHCPELSLTRTVRLLHPRHPIYLVPRGDGLYMLGATQIEAAARPHPAVRSVLELLSAAFALHPSFGEAELVEIGTDARPAFPDNLPRIRQRGRVIHVNGLFRHGYLLAPYLAEAVADLVTTGKKPEHFHED